MNKKRKYTCPCCGYQTLDEESPGTYEICPLCFWEDDPVQFESPTFEGGANIVSLKQAQQNFIEFGACQKEHIKNTRRVTASDIKDPKFKLLE